MEEERGGRERRNRVKGERRKSEEKVIGGRKRWKGDGEERGGKEKRKRVEEEKGGRE